MSWLKIHSMARTCTGPAGRNPWLPFWGVQKSGYFGNTVPAFAGQEPEQVPFRGGNDFLERHKLGQHCGCCCIIDVAERSVAVIQKLEFTEFQVKVGRHVGLLPGNAFGKVQAGSEVEIWLEGNMMIVKPDGVTDDDLLRTGARIISTYLDGNKD